jgi:hypothetical protein
MAGLVAAIALTAGADAGADDQHRHPDISREARQEKRIGEFGAGLEIREQNDISFVSGGVGDEQQDVLDAAVGRFNLKVTLAGTDGKYLGGSTIRIEDQSGNTMLDTQATGPLFLAKLPQGHYTVHARAAGKSAITRKVNVPGTGQADLVLSWTSEPDVSAGDAPATDGGGDR